MCQPLFLSLQSKFYKVIITFEFMSGEERKYKIVDLTNLQNLRTNGNCKKKGKN